MHSRLDSLIFAFSAFFCGYFFLASSRLCVKRSPRRLTATKKTKNYNKSQKEIAVLGRL
jgi:hypothetical protein